MGRIEDLPFVKKTVNIRQTKNPFYKPDFLPKNWRAPFKATIQWRPKPTYLMNWQKGSGMVAGVQQYTVRGAQVRMLPERRRKHRKKYKRKR